MELGSTVREVVGFPMVAWLSDVVDSVEDSRRMAIMLVLF